MLLKLIGFKGELPSVQPRSLPDAYAKFAFDTRLNDGSLKSFRKSRFITALTAGTDYKTINLYGGTWRGWGADVDAVPAPIANDRLYITGDGAPKMISGGTTYPLALDAPTTKLTAELSGTATSDLGSNRLYVYTWVTAFDEESAPCPISDSIYWKPGQTVTLTGFTTTPSGRNINRQRIYRAHTSTTGTKLYFIAERVASTGSFIDSVAIDAFVEELPSLYYDTPVSTLKGLTAMPNGMMAAFSGKDLYFCEPYIPHAWPDSYSLTCDYEIVGLGVFGSSLAVLTKGNPYLVTGSSPDSMTMEKLEVNLPCINARSIQDMGYAIAYASYDGLVMISSSGASVVTNGIFNREEWVKLNPSTFSTGQRDSRYFAAYSYVDGEEGIKTGTLIIDTSGEQPFVIRSSIYPSAFFYDLVSGALYYAVSNGIYEWDAVGKPYNVQAWRSKEFILPKPSNFGVIYVSADDAMNTDEMAALNAQAQEAKDFNATAFLSADEGCLNGADFNTYAIAGDLLIPVPEVSYDGSVRVYADGKLIANISKFNKAVRLPAGFLAQKIEIEYVGTLPIQQIDMARTGTELATG